VPVSWQTELYGLRPLAHYMTRVQANTHLECGGKLADFWPFLETSYHYDLNPQRLGASEAEEMLGGRPTVGLYFNGGRAKASDWRVWSERDWCDLVVECLDHMPCKYAVALIGAEYDQASLKRMGAMLRGRGIETVPVYGKPLHLAIEVVRRCDYLFSDTSGIGIVSNVLSTPTFMMLPRTLRLMEEAYADPDDIASGKYRGWYVNDVEDVVRWFCAHGPQIIENHKSTRTL
jgi:hypothetical protein